MDISYKQTMMQKISKNNKKHKGQFIDVVGFTLLRAHLKKKTNLYSFYRKMTSIIHFFK